MTLNVYILPKKSDKLVPIGPIDLPYYTEKNTQNNNIRLYTHELHLGLYRKYIILVIKWLLPW